MGGASFSAPTGFLFSPFSLFASFLASQRPCCDVALENKHMGAKDLPSTQYAFVCRVISTKMMAVVAAAKEGPGLQLC